MRSSENMIQLKVRAVQRGTSRNTDNEQTMLNCIDNSGAAIVECVQVMKKRGIRPAASIGVQS